MKNAMLFRMAENWLSITYFGFGRLKTGSGHTLQRWQCVRPSFPQDEIE
ncbi:MAG: hypothetical protein FWH42_02760 [Dehalococcoidia bacterium]|nr:hypothetical protein [Dehalococcoidia bacterium]